MSKLKTKFPCQILDGNKILSCYGCCGRDWRSKEEILSDLAQNSQDFEKIKHKTQLRLLQFRDRLSENPDELTPSGLCSNLVKFNSGCIACPLHPKINEIVDKKEYRAPHKKDLRINHCDIHYQCPTFDWWLEASDEEKENFVSWVLKQNYEAYEYSEENVFGKLLEKFQQFQS